MAVDDAHAFPGFLTPVLTQVRSNQSEKRKYDGKKVCLNRVSNLQPPVRESDTLTTEPSGKNTRKSLNDVAILTTLKYLTNERLDTA